MSATSGEANAPLAVEFERDIDTIAVSDAFALADVCFQWKQIAARTFVGKERGPPSGLAR